MLESTLCAFLSICIDFFECVVLGCVMSISSAETFLFILLLRWELFSFPRRDSFDSTIYVRFLHQRVNVNIGRAVTS